MGTFYARSVANILSLIPHLMTYAQSLVGKTIGLRNVQMKMAGQIS